MKQFFLLTLILLLASCDHGFRKENPAKKQPFAFEMRVDTSNYNKHADEEYSPTQKYFVLIADTSNSFTKLETLAQRFTESTGLKFDAMERHYETKENDYVLSDTADDEIYRGAYYPRRGSADTNFMSIEKYYIFTRKTLENTFCLIAGIFLDKDEATSMAKTFTSKGEKITVLECYMDMSCMH
jgi:hypothetical protein